MAATAPAPAEQPLAAKKPSRGAPKIDRSAGIGRTLAISALFAASFAYAVQAAPSETGGVMKYNRSPFMDAMVSMPVLTGIPVVYLVAVWTLSRWMRSRPPTDWFKRNVQPMYNVAQIVLCSYMSYGLLPTSLANPFGINTERDASVEFFVFLHFLSKYLDFADTFFMIARKSYRQISFLQVFHHATISMVWPLVLNRGWGSGTASYGAFINSVTHVIMYTHYLATSLGINNPWKRWITTFQLTQFSSCILHVLLVLAFEKGCPEHLTYLQAAYHPIMLYLFGFQMLWAPQWCTGPEAEEEEKEKKAQ